MLKVRSIHDRYRVDELIDTGSSAHVYRVTHIWLHTPMILKHLRPDAPPELRGVLLEEGRLQCAMSHQNLVAVHDALNVEDRPALVMELVNGPDLAEWIDEREVPPVDEAVALFRGILAGMAEAHRHGVVHRDLKPENVLLADQRGGPLVSKVADFGLAKQRTAGRGRHSLSTTYALIGTPEYMAPEQIRDPGLVDPRADIFSLGAILYELCTGQMAFEDEDVHRVLAMVAEGAFRHPAQVRPDLDPALCDLIVQMLATEAARRPSSCDEVLARLPTP